LNHSHPAWNAALQLLARRAHSEQELRSKLHIKGYSGEIIDNTIKRLFERSYLNDAALCKMLFKKYSSCDKYSMKYIVNKLKHRGFDETTIMSVINDDNLDGKEYHTAIKLLDKRYNNAKLVEPQKLMRFLSARGFSFKTINKVLDTICLSNN